MLLSFWVMGLLNNASFVVMIAGAKSISEGGTALVFIADTFPSLLLTLSAPYWFHLVGYSTRIYATTSLFFISFCTVAYFASGTAEEEFTPKETAGFELIGVALGSLGMGMGEASLLALAGRYDSDRGGGNIKAFSSGTGLAGVFGFAWVVVWNDWIGMTFTQSLLLANILALFYGFEYYILLSEERKFRMCPSYNDNGIELYPTHVPAFARPKCTSHSSENDNDKDSLSDDDHKVVVVQSNIERSHEKETYQMLDTSSNLDADQNENSESAELHSVYFHPAMGKYENVISPCKTSKGTESTSSMDEVEFEDISEADDDDAEDETSQELKIDMNDLSMCQRLHLVSSLWPYMVPLFTVYFCEYALQSGAWTAIGFPVQSIAARDKFYEYSNWAYQIGVFLSRSSGTIFHIPLTLIWVLPFIQLFNLILFCFTATKHFWYDWSLLFPCFFTGLLGGMVYVNAYTLINANVSKHKKEFALASATVADSFGILSANIVGLFIQSCLYRVNQIDGAIVNCPMKG